MCTFWTYAQVHASTDSRGGCPPQLLSTFCFGVTEPGARLTACKPQEFHCLHPHHIHTQHWVFKHRGTHMLFSWELGGQFQVSCLHTNIFYPLSHLSQFYFLLMEFVIFRVLLCNNFIHICIYTMDFSRFTLHYPLESPSLSVKIPLLPNPNSNFNVHYRVNVLADEIIMPFIFS